MKVIQEIQSKIDREKVFLNGASDMRRQTNNDSVRSRLDVKIEESQKLIDFFEGKLQEMLRKRDDYHQMRRLGHGVDNMSISSGSTAVAPGADFRSDGEGPPPPPPKDASGWSGERGSYGSTQYGGDMSAPRFPYGSSGPGTSAPHPRPNFTKLGLILQHVCVATAQSLTIADRSDQIQYSASGTSHSTNAYPSSVQTECRGAISQRRRKDGSTIWNGRRSKKQGRCCC